MCLCNLYFIFLSNTFKWLRSAKKLQSIPRPIYLTSPEIELLSLSFARIDLFLLLLKKWEKPEEFKRFHGTSSVLIARDGNFRSLPERATCIPSGAFIMLIFQQMPHLQMHIANQPNILMLMPIKITPPDKIRWIIEASRGQRMH